MIRTHAAPAVGLGHLRRCEALTDALQAVGGEPRWWIDDPAIRALIQRPDLMVETVASEALPPPGVADVLVLDGYQYDAPFVMEARKRVATVVVIEDLPDRWLPAHLIIQSAADDGAGLREVGPGTEVLAGPSYALVPNAFAEEPRRGYARTVQRVLVSVGGSDVPHALPKLLEWVRGALPFATLDVVVGPFVDSETVRRLEQAVRQRPPIVLWRNLGPQQLRTLMLQADLAVSAAGQTLFQLAASATPTLAITFFKHQQPLVESLARRGIVAWIGQWDEPGLREQLEAAVHRLSEASPRRALGAQARREVDGRGAQRAAEAIRRCVQRQASASPLSNGGSLTLRPVTAQDERLLWEWRNDAVVRNHSFSSDPIPWEQHQRWFQQKLASPDCRIWIAESHGQPIGHIRYDRSGDAAQLSYSIAASHRGRGWGTAVLRASAPLACQAFGVRRLIGITKRGNEVSVRSLERAGFRQVGSLRRPGGLCLQCEWRCEGSLR